MKNISFKDIKDKITENKKKVLVATLALVVVTGSIGIYKATGEAKDKASNKIVVSKDKAVSDNKTKQAKEDKDSIADNKEKDTKEKQDIKANTAKANKTNKVENKKIVANNSKSSTKSSSPKEKSNTGNTTKATSTIANTEKPKEQPKQRVWVVDQEAWDETVTENRKELVSKYYYNGNYYDTYEEGANASIADYYKGIAGGSLSPVTIYIDVPYTYTVHHDEVGHWEYR